MQKPIQFSQAELANRSNETLFQNFYLFGIEPYDLDISDFTPEKLYTAKDYTKIKLLSKFPPKTKTQYYIDE